MIPGTLRFEPLAATHVRDAFESGVPALDQYLRTQAGQDVRRHIANCFLLIEVSTGDIAAYYTLSAASLPVTDLPSDIVKRLPRYPTIPAVRIGRLAVDQRFQRRGLGELLLIDAVRRTMADAAAAFTMLVDAKDQQAASFYKRYGFRPLFDRPLTLFLPLANVQKLVL